MGKSRPNKSLRGVSIGIGFIVPKSSVSTAPTWRPKRHQLGSGKLGKAWIARCRIRQALVSKIAVHQGTEEERKFARHATVSAGLSYGRAAALDGEN